MKKYNDRDIEKLLSEMPDLNDERSFDEYYEHISKNVSRRRRNNKQSKRVKWVPILTTAAVFFLAFIITIQFLGNNGMDQANDDISMLRESSDGPTDSDESEEESAEMELEDFEEEELDSGMENTDSSNVEDNEMVSLYGRHLISYPTIDSNDDLVTIYLPDLQVMSLVPLTMNINFDDPFEFINEIHLLDEQIPLSTLIYDGVRYLGLNAESIPVVEIDEEWINQFGTTIEALMLNSLQLFFANYNVSEIHLQDSEGNPVNFPHIDSSIDRIVIDMNSSYYYQIYEESDFNEPLLILQNAADFSFENAIAEMQSANEDFHFYPSIPPEANINVAVTGEEVTIEILNIPLENNDETVTMIEALILTAKSFGYDELIFENVESEIQIGPYDLTEPIDLNRHYFVNPLR